MPIIIKLFINSFADFAECFLAMRAQRYTMFEANRETGLKLLVTSKVADICTTEIGLWLYPNLIHESNKFALYLFNKFGRIPTMIAISILAIVLIRYLGNILETLGVNKSKIFILELVSSILWFFTSIWNVLVIFTVFS